MRCAGHFFKENSDKYRNFPGRRRFCPMLSRCVFNALQNNTPMNYEQYISGRSALLNQWDKSLTLNSVMRVGKIFFDVTGHDLRQSIAVSDG